MSITAATERLEDIKLVSDIDASELVLRPDGPTSPRLLVLSYVVEQDNRGTTAL